MRKFILFMLFVAIGYNGIAQVNFNNQVIVYFKTGVIRVAPANTTANVSSANILSLLSTYGIPAGNVVPSFPTFNEADTVHYEIGESSRQMNRSKVFTITVTNPATKNNFINALNALSEVLYAESNGYASHDLIPIDGRFNDQWGLRNLLFPGRDIHAEQAWDIFTGNTNSIIAIIDDGVDINHNDLNAKINGGDNGFTISTDIFNRNFSHGSHVAGIAAAITNNAANNGVAGVDWAARIHPKNIFDGNGDPDITTSIIDAINFNANVWTLNNSWGTRNQDGSPGRYSVTIRSAFAQAYRNNRVSCIAMGNHQNNFPNEVAFPAGINSGVIAVGATDNMDNVTNFSAHGPHIDVAAPGQDIWSTNFNNNYIDLNGTSMATPHVAGLASLLKGFNTNLANDDIEQIIRLSADDVNAALPGLAGFDNQVGAGRINAERALQFLQAPNTLQHLSATGGTVFNTSGNMTRVFLGVPGLADAAYIVRRSEVRRNITFPAMCNLIGVWGRGVGTTGLREEDGRSFGEGICEVVPGTLTNTSATLRTWIYEVWTALGQRIGFFPQSANNMVFQYTILGSPLPASISGPNNFCTTSTAYTIPNLPTGIAVTWSASPAGIVTINSPNATSTTLTKIGNGVVTLTATFSNNCGALPISKTIMVGIKQISSIFIESSTHCTYNTIPVTVAAQNGNDGITNVEYKVTGPGGYNNTFYSINTSEYLQFYNPGLYLLKVRVQNACGWSTVLGKDIFVEDCSGGGGGPMSVYPNPASNSIQVEVSGLKGTGKGSSDRLLTEVIITDQTGNIKKQVAFKQGVKSTSIDISGLPAGVYFVRGFDGAQWSASQLVVTR